MFNKQYSFDEAKELYIRMENEENLEKKKQMRDDLISGTIYYIKDFVDKNIPKMESSSFEMDDIYNTAYEIWVQLIDEGFFKNNNFFTENNLLRTRIMKGISKYFSPNDVKNDISVDVLSDIIYDCFELNKNKDISEEEICRLISKNLYHDESHVNDIYKYNQFNDEKQIIRGVLKYIEENNIDNISRTKIFEIYNFIINNGINFLNSNLNEIKDTENDYSEDIAYESFEEKFKNEILEDAVNSLNDREKEIIIRRFGLKGNSPENRETIAEDFKTTPEVVRHIELKALRHLRHPSRSKKIREVFYDYSPQDGYKETSYHYYQQTQNNGFDIYPNGASKIAKESLNEAENDTIIKR